MSSNYDIRTDLKEAIAMADNLESYVRGTELYGHAGGGFFSQMPSLTIGALVMRLRRLDSLRGDLNDAQTKDLDTALAQWENTRDEWRVHYENKVVREAESRIDSMRTFFRECGDSRVNCHNNYRPEILKRTIVQELVREMNALNMSNEDATDKISAADSQLHSYMEADVFQWSEELKTLYPNDEFWWLYQKPPKVSEK